MVTLSSVRGSPGVSTWSMLLAAAWPDSTGLGCERVIVEADLDGGVAGARYGVGVEPGIDELVARIAHGADVGEALTSAGRRIDDYGWLVPGPESAKVARRIWAAPGVAASVASVALSDRRLWIIDAGRLRPGAVTETLSSSASLNVVLTGDSPADLVQVPERVHALRDEGPAVAVIVTGSPAYPIGELGAFFGTDQVMIAPRPDLGAIALISRGWTDRRLRRSAWWRSALAMAEQLNDVVPQPSRFRAHGDDVASNSSSSRLGER